MRSSLYIGATGMKSLAEGMHVTGNNLANCSTIGFKSQMALYSDLIYESQANPGEWNYNQRDSQVAVGQHGMGVRVDEIATNFTQGGFESTNSLTDLAINGKGYFVVQNADGNNMYTRAGDFNVDSTGIIRNPNGYPLMGYSITNSKTSNVLQPISIDKFATLSAQATSAISISDTNVVPSSNVQINQDNPYFSLLSSFDGTKNVPLESSQYSNAQTVTVYDSTGTSREVNIYYDGAPSTDPNTAVEFLVTTTNTQDPLAQGSSALMSGVLQFDSKGQLMNLAAYTPTDGENTDLSTWTQASLSSDGLPEFSLDGNTMSLDFGIQTESGSWTNTGTALDVGQDLTKLSILDSPLATHTAITGYSSRPFASGISQDGYGEGVLSSYDISTDGKIHGKFSNGQNATLWQIPLARFTSDDGLTRAGDNLFAATSEAGSIDIGIPETENYGSITPYYIEQSNVDISTEMVNMIITQRGFQSNSKVVTTSDEMLRTAINLKQR